MIATNNDIGNSDTILDGNGNSSTIQDTRNILKTSTLLSNATKTSSTTVATDSTTMSAATTANDNTACSKLADANVITATPQRKPPPSTAKTKAATKPSGTSGNDTGTAASHGNTTSTQASDHGWSTQTLSAKSRRENRLDVTTAWDCVNRIVRHRRKWDNDPAYRAKMAKNGWIRQVRSGQRTSSGSWSPTGPHDIPERHGHTTMLDFKSLVMAEAANLMETYTTPATTAEEQAERRMNIYIICLPAYPEWDHDTIPISATPQHDAERNDQTYRKDKTALRTVPDSINVVSGDGGAHLDWTAAQHTTTMQPHAIMATSKAAPDHNRIVAAMPNGRFLGAPADDILNSRGRVERKP